MAVFELKTVLEAMTWDHILASFSVLIVAVRQIHMPAVLHLT